VIGVSRVDSPALKSVIGVSRIDAPALIGVLLILDAPHLALHIA
jgi:hypothetical protein